VVVDLHVGIEVVVVGIERRGFGADADAEVGG
jgi:hypothetical protein